MVIKNKNFNNERILVLGVIKSINEKIKTVF